MALTKVANLTNAVQTKYQTGYLLGAVTEEIWGKFVDWQGISEGAGGSSFDFLGFEELAPAITALTEDSDVVPVVLIDDNTTVTPNEYGNAVGLTRKARFQSRANLPEVAGKLIGMNRARSVDKLIRNGVLGGTNVRYPGTVTARTSLDSTNDKVTYAFLLQLEADAIATAMEPFGDGLFRCPVHPLLMADLLQLAQVLNPTYYRTDYDSIFKSMKAQRLRIGNFEFVVHRWGKAYLSGGTTGQAATTLNGAVSAGATAITLTSDTGIAVGDYLTIGTLEANDAEQVQVTAGSASPWTIVGGGVGPNDMGLRYAHADLAAVTEAANVCAIPVIGTNSIKGVYGEATGKYGQVKVKEGLDLLDRFRYHGWYWYGGVGVWNRHLIRGEVAVSGGIRGSE